MSDRPGNSSETDAVGLGAIIGGNYQLIRLLGEGGMGRVYEAQHLRLPRRAAVKILHPGLARAGDALGRFQREAEIASSLGNKHIVKVYDFGSLPDGSPYMVMEYLEGQDLYHRMEQCGGRLGIPEIVRWMDQAVEGMDAAHQMGVVHRDLKPENLFIARDGEGGDELKIVDFGLSKMRGVSRSLTGLNSLGTPAYMSPEQIVETSAVDQRTDVYALGVTLFQMITGHLPFDDETMMGLMDKVLREPPTSARIFTPWVSAELDRVLGKALAKNPDERYPSAGALWVEARPALEGCIAAGSTDTVISRRSLPRLKAPSVVKAPTPVETPALAAPAVPLPEEPSEALELSIPSRRPAWVWPTLGLLGLALLSGGLWWFGRAAGNPAPAEAPKPALKELIPRLPAAAPPPVGAEPAARLPVGASTSSGGQSGNVNPTEPPDSPAVAPAPEPETSPAPTAKHRRKKGSDKGASDLLKI